MVHYYTAGESHGPKLVTLLEGIPAGVEIQTDDIVLELAKRRLGTGRGDRQRFEKDVVRIVAGVIHGKTIGSPIAIEIENSEWHKWDKIMSPDPCDSSALNSQLQPNVPEKERSSQLVKPRPGHADLEGMLKYGFATARNVLERASARETAARVAAGTVAKKFLEQVCGTTVRYQVVQFGACKRQDAADNNEFMQLCENAALDAKKRGETIGGIVQVIAEDVPRGLGSYAVGKTRLDAALSASVMSIQAFKGVEIGDGFALAATFGTEAHDHIVLDEFGALTRTSNHAGGIEGGISNGMPVVVRAVVKPIPSVPGGLPTINMQTRTEDRAHSQRSDTSAVFPASVVASSMVALTLADFVCSKFGSDSLEEITANFKAHQLRIRNLVERGVDV
ncbi:MAG: chorismate synthase [Candidatus Ancillula trichonymphae]|jgi:chorismate synthase|nr:chorismate synthase [Candidatus Ancillula trichonymphae]